MRNRIAVGLLFLIFTFFTPTLASAQLGSGIVFDPTNYKNAVLRYIQLQKQLAQLQKTYTQVQAQYDLMVAMSRSIDNMQSRYQAPFARWKPTYAQDVFGNNADWVRSLNTSDSSLTQGGYQKATTRLQQYDQSSLSLMPQSSLERMKSGYSLVELTDGANTGAMTTIGDIRQKSQDLETQIAKLEQDSLSSDAKLNSQVAVLNKINAANVLMLRSIQDTNKLLLSLLEQQLALSKRLRDPAAESINNDIQFRKNFGSSMQFNTTIDQSLKLRLHVQ